MDKMKLMPMTDFVLERMDFFYKNEIDLFRVSEQVEKYARFLKQPLALWMFVPCDDEGNVLRNDDAVSNSSDLIRKVTSFRAAKDRCLFEGFEQIIYESEGINKYVISMTEKFSLTHFLATKFSNQNWDFEFTIVEDLLLDYRPELTQSALKQIFG